MGAIHCIYVLFFLRRESECLLPFFSKKFHALRMGQRFGTGCQFNIFEKCIYYSMIFCIISDPHNGGGSAGCAGFIFGPRNYSSAPAGVGIDLCAAVVTSQRSMTIAWEKYAMVVPVQRLTHLIRSPMAGISAPIFEVMPDIHAGSEPRGLLPVKSGSFGAGPFPAA
mgnify:CR=1 FL=1